MYICPAAGVCSNNFSPIDGRRDEVLRVEGSIRAEAAVSRGQEPAVLAPGERGPVLRVGAAVHGRAAVDLHHGRCVSQQHPSYPCSPPVSYCLQLVLLLLMNRGMLFFFCCAAVD